MGVALDGELFPAGVRVVLNAGGRRWGLHPAMHLVTGQQFPVLNAGGRRWGLHLTVATRDDYGLACSPPGGVVGGCTKRR